MAKIAILSKETINTAIGAVYVVQSVIEVSASKFLRNGVHSEETGIAWARSFFKDNTLNVIRTSYMGRIRNKYAGKGDWYSPAYNAFISPPLEDNWTFDVETLTFNPPE